MRGYEEDLDEEAGYADYYSDDGLEQEYEDDEEEEEERPPPKEELEYLELRQKLKDSIRKNMGKGSSNGQSSQEKRKKLPYNDFGSFFGPSRPVISSRVIQESKSLLENEVRTARTPTSNQTMKRPVPSNGSVPKNVSQEKRPKVVNQVKRKAETLKDTRDYSFLLSDDAELPVSKKESLSRSSSFPHSGMSTEKLCLLFVNFKAYHFHGNNLYRFFADVQEPRSAQLSARPKQSSGINGRAAPREEKRPVSANGHSRPASSGGQLNQSRAGPSGSQMQSRPASSGRPVASSGSQMQNPRPGSSSSQMQQRPISSGSQRPGSSTNRQAPTRPPGSTLNGQSTNRNGQSANRNGQPANRNGQPISRSAPPKLPVDHRKQMSSSTCPSRSTSMARPLPSKPSISAGKSSLQSSQRPSSSRPLSSDPRQRVVEQRRVSRDPATSRMIPKQSAPTSKHPTMSKPPLKRPLPRDIVDNRRPPLKKKKPARMSEDDMALSMIRKMFKTDRYADIDDDDRNMEANFDDIMKEERRSARIAREEDEEEAKLIEEEERRERLRKNRKLSR